MTMENPTQPAPPRLITRRRSLMMKKQVSCDNLTESCSSLDSFGIEALENAVPANRRGGRRNSFQKSSSRGLSASRRNSLSLSRNLVATNSSDSLASMVSCITMDTQEDLQGSASGSRKTLTARRRGLRRSKSSENLLSDSCHSLESFASVHRWDRRRGGLRRNAKCAIDEKDASDSTTKEPSSSEMDIEWVPPPHTGRQCRRLSWCSTATSVSQSDGSTNWGSQRIRLRRQSMTSLLHHKLGRLNSMSTLATTKLAIDELEVFMEELKQAISQKMARQVFLERLMKEDAILAVARYSADNVRGALLLMRRRHKQQYQIEQVRWTCTQLMELNSRVERAIKQHSPEAMDDILDIQELQGLLNSLLNRPEQEGHVMCSDNDLRWELEKLINNWVEI